jgi:predicted ATPase/DNA-binding winged helix-turn-helix (wHTH) protein
MAPPTAATPLRFGRFELQPRERRLLVDGRAAHLGARALDLLLALAERAGQLVDKNTLIDLVWPGRVVQENNLPAQMSVLRKLLGEDVIATIPGRGYRFVARLEAAAEAPAPAPAQAGRPTLRSNLPAELTPLIGRGAALAELGQLIDRHRLVSVVGAGGIGKSLLTQHVLAARRDAYAHGVCWIDLAAVTDAAALPGAAAAALGAEGGHGDALAALVSAVSSLTMLLALDNAEHLLADVASLCHALHDAAPGLRLLVTSQAPLRLAAEQVCRIGPLAVPDAALPAAEALAFGAIALFAERARAVDRGFHVSDANAATVIDICRTLDGLPLAIELAAARAPRLGPVRLSAALQERFAVLTQGRNRAAPERQRTLRAALEWSFDLLTSREQQVFRRLGVVAGSASLALIQQVLLEPGGEPDAWAVLDDLDTLVDRSLVALSPSGDDEPRYRLLETPRAYALEGLERTGEREALRRRHAFAVAALFDAAYDEYFSGVIGIDEWLRRCEADFDNARDALHWAREAGETDVALRIGATMLRALPSSLHVERMALADACEAGIVPSAPEQLQMKAWLELSCALADSQKARGRRAAEHALALARRLHAQQPDRFMLYHALSRAASAAAQASDLAAAGALLDELLRLEDPSWPAHRLLWGTEAAQWLARMRGDSAEALRRARRLLALDRERGSHAALATSNLIDAELAVGDAATAARLGTTLVESLLRTRHEYNLAFARVNLLAALLALDDMAQAGPVAQAAWAKAAIFDVQHAVTAYLALFCALDGRPRAAVKLAAYSETLYAARGEARERNETAATLRARSQARHAIDDATFTRLHAEGATMRDSEVEAIAFGVEDVR